jgi:hypothetical protein
VAFAFSLRGQRPRSFDSRPRPSHLQMRLANPMNSFFVCNAADDAIEGALFRAHVTATHATHVHMSTMSVSMLPVVSGLECPPLQPPTRYYDNR